MEGCDSRWGVMVGGVWCREGCDVGRGVIVGRGVMVIGVWW